MLLSELIPECTSEVEITDLAYDSRAVKPGSLFFCVRGATADGHEFARQAVARGAAALVAERPLGVGVPEVIVPSVRARMGPVASQFFGDPSASLPVVGVTGTNGKTTTTFLLRQLFEAAGRRCGLLGTIKTVAGGAEQFAGLTTPEAIELQRELRRMVDRGDEACVLEVSSHGLAQSRAAGTEFAAAVFTNLSHDHLDFHGTMDRYFEAKRALFADAPGAAITNIDDRYGRRLARTHQNALTFSVSGLADFAATRVQTTRNGTRFMMVTPSERVEVETPLVGLYNVSNALGATAAAMALGIPLEVVVSTLSRSHGPPGRFERVDGGQAFDVIIDYAHSPDALRQVLVAARRMTTGRVVCVFGCAGDRDRTIRAPMGAIASRLADRVVVTSDNPCSEDPAEIVAEIMQGANGGSEAILDRRAAIAHALTIAEPGDTVLIAGRGHERWQQIGERVARPFCDVTVAREVLAWLEAQGSDARLPRSASPAP